MTRKYTVREGDCVSSIAHAHGLSPQHVWEAPENEPLRRERTSPHVLKPGDEVVLPDKTERWVPCATGRTHTFRLKGIPERFRLRLHEDGGPRARVPYRLVIGDVTHEGETDDKGLIECAIPPGAREARLEVGGEEYTLSLGTLQPVSTDEGLRARLANLGYLEDDSGGDEALTQAVTRFQAEHGLMPNGTVDETTREKLREAHGV
ncbi:LysM domain-containing protein [Myxococcus sp. RHSTA-1-4]|uniref:LysM peptidoglycan-binding domain-containing protein n=1 Tax=Myxococcus sp. RHSTA-1-4 TaxID=2874601 RepID=UPI001CC0E30F|nr:peptidoglycan-binding protein [Myxococcus sp. RHSTA-1-4]MBZ4418437.1 peptidoglycan-binding protein [Myxococcus sp. RHSTA-1-4]